MVPVVHGDDEHFGIVVCFAAGLLCKSFSFPQKTQKITKRNGIYVSIYAWPSARMMKMKA